MSADPAITSATRSPLAIIAGGGDFPPRLAEIVTGSGRPLFVAALEGAADPAGFGAADLQSYRLGQLGRLLDELRRRSITELVLIGSLPRPSFAALRPEASTLKYLPHFARAFRGGDDHLLRGVVSFFEGQGFAVHGPADIAPDMTAPIGALGRRVASPEQKALIARGFELLAALSPFDVGQAAILADHRVIAIEAAEGTDAMIRRVADMVAAGRLRIAKGDGVLVKAPKDGQDLRVDMPAIGPQTLRNVVAAGLAGIGLRAGRVLVGDAAGLGRLADQSGLFVEGVARDGA
ncbi:MAG: UDP-2,3-diacylglucosamine diphosphatase LpxI [Bosea sp. (in: a-proteobacteria)]|uniref:LpxI family protein n=1 Tax=Bosea sp. (in: a-proteobacteria) TaxID=1871050 RepID=UPI0025BB9BB0|nr:UDP-2,3-diacylglucosamine diphosphatase LpxI [Bosea sp. (in: a-proteobacteria)]MDP3603680.1 UDP-2,3-diacylglucosamine diphosphatase LpxI [Bosea sp. (in: a-proteobacteria)]